MNRSTVLWLGALGIGGYLLYRWGKRTVAGAVPNLQPAGNPATVLNTFGMPVADPGSVVQPRQMLTDPGYAINAPSLNLPAYTGPITAAQMAGWS